MFERLAAGDEPVPAVPDPAVPVTAATLRSWITGLTGLDRRVDDAERITQLELLERLKSAAAAAQAVVTVDLAASQRAEQAAADFNRSSSSSWATRPASSTDRSRPVSPAIQDRSVAPVTGTAGSGTAGTGSSPPASPSNMCSSLPSRPEPGQDLSTGCRRP